MNDLNIKEIKVDRRTLRTKKVIKNALMKLMCQSEISKITIKDLAIEADINRKTFYNHYIDIYDVLKDIEDDLMKKLLNILDNFDLSSTQYNPYPILKELTVEINKDIEFYNLLLSYNSSSNLISKITNLLKKYLYEYCCSNTKLNTTLLPYTINFISAGIISSYQEWFNSDKEITLEELSEGISLLIANGINCLL